MKKEIVVAVSGGFDPVHAGHVRMFNEAKKLGDKLIVILNCDEWLMRKKGYVFMKEAERAEIIRSFKAVDEVVIHYSEFDDVCGALMSFKPDIFANGGDRKDHNTPEENLCQTIGIKTVYGVGGDKIQSSSELVNKAKSHGN